MIMIPYLALLAGFAGFVIGNGGVVLGERPIIQEFYTILTIFEATSQTM